jgi:hypothetical protein
MMSFKVSRRQFAAHTAGILAAGAAGSSSSSLADDSSAITFENRFVQVVIDARGRIQHFTDKQTGQELRAPEEQNVWASIRQDGKMHLPSSVALDDGHLQLVFDSAQCNATIEVVVRHDHFLFRVESLTGSAVDEFTFGQVRLNSNSLTQQSVVACALALNLQTRVRELPQATDHLCATCYPQFGFVGAEVAWLTCPSDQLRATMQRVVSAADQLPHSSLGGPWAWGQPANQGSYLFNFHSLSEETVDDWINLAQSLGMNQIDFHGGTSFRFGDCRPNPETYPRGVRSLRAVIDRLHDAGISAGLHTYAFFIHKSCPWVTPVPDSRLAKAGEFTLSESITAESTTIPVVESTESVSTITGFFVRNSVTVQIDKELITFRAVSKQRPFAFTECERGACGTKVSSHAAGAKVYHLKECFGLFVPDPKTGLLAEVAAKIASVYNFCGFDMIYLDALDGEDILGGGQNGWHYGSKFVFELQKRLDRPAVMEMSTFHHHLWYVRSRMGAWDHPTRSHKRFVDLHCQANESNAAMFLPGQLGWWAFKTWTDAQGEPTFADDIEYLMARCLGTDTGFALMGIDPGNVGQRPALPRLAGIIKRYEDLRHSQEVPANIKQRLRTPGEEFTLIGDVKSGWQFQPITYDKHKAESEDQQPVSWNVHNRYAAQPLHLRIEALFGSEPYDCSEGRILVDAGSELEAFFAKQQTQTGVSHQIVSVGETVPDNGQPAVCYQAQNQKDSADGAWCHMTHVFAPPENLSQHQGLGMWVKGDGQGQVLNIQLRSPSHISHAIGDHYIPLDFEGWQYFELIEPEGERHADYSWPYGGAYSIYREKVNYAHVESIGLWLNQLPAGKASKCCIGSIKALPLVDTALVQPVVKVGDQTLRFDTEIETGCYLEFHGLDDCRLYGKQGELIREVQAIGDVPQLAKGNNQVTLEAGNRDGLRMRARVTVISRGTPLTG